MLTPFHITSRNEWCACWRTVLSLVLLGGTGLNAQEGKLVSRPLTPMEISDLGLPSTTQTSGGLKNVGVGAPIYIEAQVPAGTVVTGVAWTLAGKPDGSAAELAESPLGSEVPIYNPGDREVNLVAGRRVLTPDVVGHYTVSAVVSSEAGETTLSQVFTGATYTGVGEPGLMFRDPPQCALCHSDQVHSWSGTNHASAMTRKVDGIGTSRFLDRCLKCHNTGFDTTPAADNGGFDDVARLLGWVMPETAAPGNWEAMPDALKELSNVQCESCHGPGSQHTRSGGNPAFITMSTSSGDCGQCHDSAPYHTKNTQWNLSRHAVATRYPTGEGRESCVGCHSGVGFIDRLDGLAQSEYRTEWEAIVCASCHDPHNAANPHQLRQVDHVTLMNGVRVTGGGNGRICMNCHISRRDAEEYVQEYHGRFGPHHGPQTDMLAGTNAVEYDRHIPSSAHLFAVQDTCASCHMQELPNDHPGKNLSGEHTFKSIWDAGTPDNHADDVHLVNACVQCHGPIESFDFARQDFDGDGDIEGVQTEVHGLMAMLANHLPPLGENSVDVTPEYTPAQLKGAFNYLFVEADGSHGIHNTSYTVNILKASIADLTGDGTIMGDSDNDRLPDDWEREHFGSLTAQDADGDPDGDGINNAFELVVGTNPAAADSDGDGFSDFEEMHVGTDPLNAEDNPTIGASSIYVAAEMVFFTEAGKLYQVQHVSDLTDAGWTNVGDPVEGTGEMLQHFISTRATERGFYRVIEVQP